MIDTSTDTEDTTVSGEEAAAAALRDALAALPIPKGDPGHTDPETLASRLDEAMGSAARIRALATTPANDLDGALRTALQIHFDAGDLAATLKAVCEDITALAENAEAAASNAKAALNTAMHGTGAPEVRLTSYGQRARLGSNTKVVRITDETLLPLTAFNVPKPQKPKPDKHMIKAIIRLNGSCPGAEEVDGDPHIVIESIDAQPKQNAKGRAKR